MEREERTVGGQGISKSGAKYLHITISKRDTFLSDIKNGTVQGIISMSLAIINIIIDIVAIFISYANKGAANPYIGILPFVTLIFAIASIIFALVGLKNKFKIRHYLEHRGIIFSIIQILFLIFVYVRGLFIFLEG